MTVKSIAIKFIFFARFVRGSREKRARVRALCERT